MILLYSIPRQYADDIWYHFMSIRITHSHSTTAMISRRPLADTAAAALHTGTRMYLSCVYSVNMILVSYVYRLLYELLVLYFVRRSISLSFLYSIPSLISVFLIYLIDCLYHLMQDANKRVRKAQQAISI